jgi:hypothetical protein
MELARKPWAPPAMASTAAFACGMSGRAGEKV